MLPLEIPPAKQVERIAKGLIQRPASRHADALFDALEALHPQPVILIARLRHLSKNEQWDTLIALAEERLETVTLASERQVVLGLLIDGLLERDVPATDDRLADAERAFGHVQTELRERGTSAAVERRLARITDALLPADLQRGRGTPTNPAGDVWRGFTRFAKATGRLFGGREASIPHNAAVLASAPELLAPGRVEQVLAGDARLDAEFAQATRHLEGTEAGAVALALGLGGLYSWSQIDDSVLDALLAASPGASDSLWGLQELAETTAAKAGAMTRLSGYVAEQQVALDLTRQGHEVEFPATPNQPGYDLLVDGQPVQVKCTLDADYALEHFERYPDIPLIVNAELAEKLGDHPMVYVDEHLSHAQVAEATTESLDALADFANADDLLPIPFISVVFAGVRNYGDLKAGRIDGDAYLKRVGVDAAYRTVGGTIGATIGGALGSIFPGPGTVLGASFGALIGSMAGGTGVDAVNHAARCDARDVVVHALGEFADWLTVTLLGPRRGRIEERHRRLVEWAAKADRIGFAPATTAHFVAASREAVGRAQALEAWMHARSTGDFDRAHAGWIALRDAGRFIHPELKPRLAVVTRALDAYAATSDAIRDGVLVPV